MRLIALGAGALALVGIAIWAVTSGGDDKATRGTRSTASPEVFPTPASSTAASSTAPVTTMPTSTDAPTTVGTSPAGPQGSLTETCSNDVDGFTLSYPTGWRTEADNPNWRCSLFDPNQFVIDPNTEVPPTAVLVFVDQHPFAETYASLSDQTLGSVLSTSDVTVAGRPGSTLEISDSGQVMYDAGTKHYYLLVDEGDRTVVFETIDVVDGYESNKQVIDAMAQTLQVNGG